MEVISRAGYHSSAGGSWRTRAKTRCVPDIWLSNICMARHQYMGVEGTNLCKVLTPLKCP